MLLRCPGMAAVWLRTRFCSRKFVLVMTNCCHHHHQELAEFSTGAGTPPAMQGMTFEDILSENNKRRAQQKLTCVLPVRSVKEYPLKPSHAAAAVLVPMCLVRGEPSLLFTLRSSQLRKHRGQVSFPGGNVDKTDTDLTHTALRETHEELGIDPATFDVWGQMNPLPGSDGGKIIYPILAQTGEVDVASLNINRDEVEEAFCVSMRHLCDNRNIRFTQFREGPGYTLPVYLGGSHRIWGLTAVIVHQLLNIIAPGLYSFKVRHKRPVFDRSRMATVMKSSHLGNDTS